ncbi:MAG: Fic family protein [Phycisphaerales bacterium]
MTAFVPDDLPPRGITAESLASLMPEILGAERAVARLDGLSRGFSSPWLVARPLMRREAETSSRIEDTIATAEEVALYEAGYGAARNETVEVANYLVALQHGLSSDLPISRRLICEMHRLLLREVRGENNRPGEIRASQNRIGGTEGDARTARFVPPPPGQGLEDSLAAFERFVNAPPAVFPPIVAIALAHYQFEAIHPFGDGNGRVGRALAALSLCRSGLLQYPLVYLSGYFDRHRQSYYDLLLHVSTRGDWNSWLRFFLAAVSSQARDAGERIIRLRDLYDVQRTKLQRGRGASLSLALLDHLYGSPAVTAASAQRALDTTDPTARKAIKRLEESGLLKEHTGREYGKVWVARPILDIINAVFETEENSEQFDRDGRESEGQT